MLFGSEEGIVAFNHQNRYLEDGQRYNDRPHPPESLKEKLSALLWLMEDAKGKTAMIDGKGNVQAGE